jgi:small subunit ribosomal protein S17
MSSKKTNSIGVDVPRPAKSCTDPRCPFHGTLSVHGRTFTGTVSSAKASRTVSVEFTWRREMPKYERFETRKTVIKAHSPPCMDPKEGAKVTVMETRPLSKTKSFVVIQVHDTMQKKETPAKSNK